MNFKQLEIFLTIVDTGSFKLAAQKLFMSAPSVSAQITSLEEELSCVLFDRKHSGTMLTPEGIKMCDYARHFLNTRSKLITELNEDSSNTPTYIQAGITEAAMPYFTHEILPYYFPNDINLYFSVQQMTHNQIEKALLNHEIDTGISCMPCKSSRCISTVDQKDSLILLLPTEEYQKLKDAESFDLREILLQMPLILPSFQSDLRPYVEKLIYDSGLSLSDIQIAAEFDRGEIIFMMIAQKLGISFIKKHSLSLYNMSLFQGKVSSIELPVSAEIPVYLIIREGYHFPKKMRVFCSSHNTIYPHTSSHI